MKCPICGNELKTKNYDWLDGFGYCETNETCNRCGYNYYFSYGSHKLLYPLVKGKCLTTTEITWSSCYEKENSIELSKRISKEEKKFRKALLRKGIIKNCIKHRR